MIAAQLLRRRTPSEGWKVNAAGASRDSLAPTGRALPPHDPRPLFAFKVGPTPCTKYRKRALSSSYKDSGDLRISRSTDDRSTQRNCRLSRFYPHGSPCNAPSRPGASSFRTTEPMPPMPIEMQASRSVAPNRVCQTAPASSNDSSYNTPEAPLKAMPFT